MIAKKYLFDKQRYISFKTIDAVVTPTVYLQPDSISIEGTPVNFTYNNDTIYITDPVSGWFIVTITKQGYITHSSIYSARTINDSIISMAPEQTGTNGVILTSWTQGTNKIDFDSHLLIYNGNNKLKEIYYPSNSRTYSDANTSATLDHDDTGSGTQDFGGNETITINPVYNGYRYIFVMLDFANKTNSTATQLSSRNTTCNVTIGTGPTTTITAPVNGVGQYWEVFEINNGQLSQLNTITNTNTYNITV